MIPNRSGSPPLPSGRKDACPRLNGQFGSLDAFWSLIEPALTHLRASRVCEIGVEKGVFTDRLLRWARDNDCVYIGIDPAPAPGMVQRVEDADARNRLLVARSLDALPTLESCDVYFVDGDHNYHTVRNELELIAGRPGRTAAQAFPLIFAHDVSWPFARRDMYHQPDAIPPVARHPYSSEGGVSLEGDDLISGGLRAPGQYSIAEVAGGACNGVLTAVEDFVASEAGGGWLLTIVPVAYGLAILSRSDEEMPEGCRAYLQDMHAACAVMAKFHESCEANFLRLYLHGDHAQYQREQSERALHAERCAHHQTLGAYEALEKVYQEATVHHAGLSREYDRLQELFAGLEAEYQTLLKHCAGLQDYIDYLVAPRDSAQLDGESSPATAAESRVHAEAVD
jgi:hypothetical protein